MREIKFRGLTGDTNEWKYGYYAKTTLGDNENAVSLGDARIHDLIIENGTMWHIDGRTKGQFTGLKDKNGTEIYEGDIIKHEYYEELQEVYWDEALVTYKVKPEEVFIQVVDSNRGLMEVKGSVHKERSR